MCGGSRSGIGNQGIELVYANYVDKDVLVIADGEQIRRVIHNLISNAIKYMDKSKGIIQIRVKDVGDFIQVEVEDNGKGIASKDLTCIFDRFIEPMFPEIRLREAAESGCQSLRKF